MGRRYVVGEVVAVKPLRRDMHVIRCTACKRELLGQGVTMAIAEKNALPLSAPMARRFDYERLL